MKLYYWKNGNEINFGDDLNPWLWHKLIPNILDNDPTTAFIGIGTVLNSSLRSKTPDAKIRVIFGSGAGYGGKNGNLVLDDTHKVYCVRGPLTARKLGLSLDYSICDSAILTRKVFDFSLSKKYTFSFMPHHSFISKGVPWQEICQQAGIEFIDSTKSVEECLTKIAQTEILIAEAMHGAILADAFRVPWIPIITHGAINRSKWEDWCSSIDIEYQPLYFDQISYLKTRSNTRLYPLKKIKQSWVNNLHLDFCLKGFRHIVKHPQFFLSDSDTMENLTEKLSAKLQTFLGDYHNGEFQQ
ncbi:MAG: polysaccharide pyruvyl transferase family protein [Cyanobacterium sp. T60_A2020_053]|nr:polysaccharide pyruvyl transferase family protein [Cyanobacterium sp. T60_A2020_053]